MLALIKKTSVVLSLFLGVTLLSSFSSSSFSGNLYGNNGQTSHTSPTSPTNSTQEILTPSTSFKEVTAQLDQGGDFYFYLNLKEWVKWLSDEVALLGL
jgi:hypothetical protein